MTKYFLFTFKDTQGTGVSAFGPENIPLAQDLVSLLDDSVVLPFDLTLIKLIPHTSGIETSGDLSDLREIWLDYLPNSLAWPLVSEKLMQIIARQLIHDEDLFWISASVSTAAETRNYYVPRFGTMHDVLDWEKTTMVPKTKHIIRPVFSAAKLRELAIFPLPAENNLWKITSSLYVSDKLKKSMESENVTGVSFEQANLS